MVLRRHWTFGLGAATVSLAVTALSAPAFAQSPAPAPPPPLAPAPAQPAPPPQQPTVAPAPTPTPAPPVAPVLDPASPAPAASLPELPPPAASEPAAPAAVDDTPPVADEDWYDAFDVRLFADAYFSLNYNFPKPQFGNNDVIRAFDSANGFSLAWAGLDISHAADPVGGTLALRFGPSARRYNSSCLSGTGPGSTGKCDADYGLENVKQAFASWRPGGQNGPVSIDFGKFDTIYGAEVAESQDNINYTRGVLYWLGQPAFHTGLRLNADVTSNFGLRALAVNGWNNTVDNNAGKTFGVQATVHAPRGDGHDVIAASVGYLGGPERDDYGAVACTAGNVFNAASQSGCSPGTIGTTTGTVDRATSDSKGWRHFLDLVVTSDPVAALHLVLNADFGVESVRDTADVTHFSPQQWWGVMAGARYLASHAFAVAGRAEYYRDDDGLTMGSVNGMRIGDATLFTGTLTLDYLPSKNLLLRLDNRLDHSSKEMFPKGVREFTGTLVTSTLGVVVTTN